MDTICTPWNNARAIIKSKEKSFEKSPSMAKAQELESMGVCVDWSEDDMIMDSLQTKNK